MDEENEQQGFKVIDRRRFTEEGELKNNSEAGEQENARKTAPAPEPKPSPRPSEAKTQTPSPASQERSKTPDPDELGVDFSSFIVSLATQALMMLGEMPNPESGLLATNYEAARQTIDILALLENKTTGNLSDDEQKLLTEILASLRIAYVRKLQSGSVGPQGNF